MVNVIIITDKMAFLIIKEIRTKFLQFDNLDETGNRIVIIFSEIALEVMQIAKDWHLDGTFKNCPNFFQQLLTLHSVIMLHTLPYVFFFFKKRQNKLMMKP